MKKQYLIIAFLLSCAASIVYSQQRVITGDGKVVQLNQDRTWAYYTETEEDLPSIKKWRALTQNPQILGFFSGLFDKIGVRVIDTGEELTCIQYADSATFNEGIDKNDVDFIVDIYSYQVDRLASHVRTGEINEVEQFRILTTLFTPVATAGFNNPAVGVFMTGRFFSWFIKRKNITHMYLLSPEPEEEPDIHYSLLFINRQWLLVPGFYGKPERVFKIEKQKGLELHRKMFSVMKADSWLQWLKFASWYKKWRAEVEVT